MKPSYKNRFRQFKVFNPPREKKPIIIPKSIIIILILLIIISGIFYILFYSPIFIIKKIEIIGPVEGKLSNLLDKLNNQNLFLVNSRSIKSDLLLTNPEFLNIEVLKGIPNTIRIKFQERQPKIIWQSNGQKFLIDENGILFKELKTDLSLPLVVDSQNVNVKILTPVASKNFIDFVTRVNTRIINYGLKISEYRVNETTFQVDAVTDKGFRIIFDTTKSESDQLESFDKVYKEYKNDIKEYVDLRVNGWVYYK